MSELHARFNTKLVNTKKKKKRHWVRMWLEIIVKGTTVRRTTDLYSNVDRMTVQ